MYFVLFIITYFFISYSESKLNKCEFNCTLSCKNRFFVLILFFCIYYIALSTQYEVGTDYNEYIRLFSSKGPVSLYHRKKEYGFYYLCLWLTEKKLPPQTGFFILNIIQFLCIIIFLYKVRLVSYKLFFLLYLSVGTFIYNQTNVMRQYTSACIIILAFLSCYKRKYLISISLILFASLFHNSSLLVIPFLFVILLFSKKRSIQFHIIELLVLIFFARFNLITILFKYVPYVNNYSHYLESAWGTQQIGFVNILTKYIYIPFYLLSLLSFKRLKTENEPMDIFLFQLGYFAFCFRLFSLSSSIFNRFSVYFDFFSVFPLYYFLLDMYKGKIVFKHFNTLFIFCFYALVIGLFFLKTVAFASAEYDYKSILFLF